MPSFAGFVTPDELPAPGDIHLPPGQYLPVLLGGSTQPGNICFHVHLLVPTDGPNVDQLCTILHAN
jgi:hypothetical protein